jgi:hypothetical protein
MRLRILILFISLSSFFFAQKKKDKDVTITGTAYIKSSISPGVIGMQGIRSGESPFKYQTIYFQGDSLGMSNAITDSLGKFFVKLKPGVYTVIQAEGLKPQKTPGLNNFGTAVIEVKSEGNESFVIVFENRSNRRQAMGGKGIPSGKPTKEIKSTTKDN